jgi:signal transduction histidine kinase/ActR/RegA family two-component response regulator
VKDSLPPPDELREALAAANKALEAEARRRMEAEARLRQAQKMEVVGQLTGGVAHDFNNILQVIMGNLELLKRMLSGHTPPAQSREAWSAPIENALRASRSAAQLTHRLLAFSRLQPLEPRVLEVNELIADMSHMIRHTLGETIELSTRLAPELWSTLTDRNQLQSAFLNLVVNARDAMPEGGQLVIETQNVEFTAAYPGNMDSIAPGRYVLLSVSDTGCGIPRDLLDKVFEPFVTTKDAGKGSGLGLSMVYGFAKQSGGYVKLYSEVGKGTTVKLFLPRSQAMKEEPIAPDAVARARAGETILHVEDDKDVRRYVLSALEGLGYQVLQAADAQAALRLLDGDTGQRVDLLFADVVLPGGMSGRALSDEVRKRHPGLPVLFTSGYTRDAMLPKRRLDRDVQVLSKPHDLEALASHVRKAIDQR